MASWERDGGAFLASQVWPACGEAKRVGPGGKPWPPRLSLTEPTVAPPLPPLHLSPLATTALPAMALPPPTGKPSPPPPHHWCPTPGDGLQPYYPNHCTPLCQELSIPLPLVALCWRTSLAPTSAPHCLPAAFLLPMPETMLAADLLSRAGCHAHHGCPPYGGRHAPMPTAVVLPALASMPLGLSSPPVDNHAHHGCWSVHQPWHWCPQPNKHLLGSDPLV